MSSPSGKAIDNPPNYEGKEHVKFKAPGYTKHHIRNPEDQPHMKSRIPRTEEHEAEDNFHMDVPDLTEDTLEKTIPRAKMVMDAPDYGVPKKLRGQITHNVPYEGEKDTSGEEEMGPNDMQGSGKEHKKKMIVAVLKSKMKKKKY